MQVDVDHHSAARQYMTVDIGLVDLRTVNWSRAPRPWKLYRGCKQIPLSYEAPITTESMDDELLTNEQIGQLLRNIYGLTRLQWWRSTGLHAPRRIEGATGSLARTHLRPVPTGGGLCSGEMYVFTGSNVHIGPGVYHYDAVHHALDTLREGNYLDVLNNSLAQPPNTSPIITIILSCCFWKNAFKYGNLSYRIQCLDLGVLIAQTLVVARHHLLRSHVHYQFLDHQISHLLGLDLDRESAYAVINLHPISESSEDAQVELDPVLPVLVQPIPDMAFTKTESLSQLSLPYALHQASLIPNQEILHSSQPLSPISTSAIGTEHALSVAYTPIDLSQGIKSRHSGWNNFKPTMLSQKQFSQLIYSSGEGYHNDLDQPSQAIQHTLLFCVVNHVEQVEPGVYCYDPKTQMIRQIVAGDMRPALQAAQVQPEQNVVLTSMCLFPVICYEQGLQAYGDRWYRIQNMEAGILAQRLCLASATLGLGCQVSLTYNVQRVNELLRLPPEWTNAVQLMIAAEYPAGRYYQQIL